VTEFHTLIFDQYLATSLEVTRDVAIVTVSVVSEDGDKC